MSATPSKKILDDLFDYASSSRKLSKQKEDLTDFLAAYYLHAPADDLAQSTVENLYGAAHSHWSSLNQFNPGDLLIRAYNPDSTNEGWTSPHTIIEIVADNMPFLVDSASMAINRRNLTIHLTIHPVIILGNGKKEGEHAIIASIDAENAIDAISLIQFQIDRQSSPSLLGELEEALRSSLGDVALAFQDWQVMKMELLSSIENRHNAPPKLSQEQLEEIDAFTLWMAADHFTFLGYCEFEVKNGKSGYRLAVKEESTLGILTPREGVPSPWWPALPIGGDEESLSMLMNNPAWAGQPLIVTKANMRSTIHRPVHMDFLGMMEYDSDHNLIGFKGIMGLFTSSMYDSSIDDIPLIRKKVKNVLNRSQLPESGHARKKLRHILETYPRDALFQTNEDELLYTAVGIQELQERQQIKLFIRRDHCGWFYSCLVYVPRTIFSRELRVQIEEILNQALGGSESEFDTLVSESILVRNHFIIRVPPGIEPKLTAKEIEEKITLASRTWHDDLKEALLNHFGEEGGNGLYQHYCDAFPPSYRDDFPAAQAVSDIKRIESSRDCVYPSVTLESDPGGDQKLAHLKLITCGRPIELSEVLPLIENLGMKVITEHPYSITPEERAPIWLYDFEVRPYSGSRFDIPSQAPRIEEAIFHILREETENDGFNRLLLNQSGLEWRQAALFRALSRYLHQTRSPYSERYIIDCLVDNSEAVKLLLQLFHTRFDPSRRNQIKSSSEHIIRQLKSSMDKIESLDEDRVMHALLGLIRAIVRTNYFQKHSSGSAKEYFSFKINSSMLSELPEPRPLFEIFIYSPRVEGVHLRGGKIARGGIRWSDRRDDFRTEILGLMKAQMVKNAVIVPEGSKGGFVIKRPPPEATPEEIREEVVRCYKTYIRGLLDITDNLVEDRVVTPEGINCHDDSDPYLVVAADKGTATFSDIANQVVAEYGFWLGDGFASGGSAGYDHKKMGITARGAWESVKRHFYNLGKNIDLTPFTVAGIGDMGGDVFGNGMLLSRQIKLIAAFNHKHIFVDPAPDPEHSWQERKRLFNTPGSSWLDYNPGLLSPGGGVYSRKSKTIKPSPEMCQLLRINEGAITPTKLISAILKAPVDLLWNGGIGTYVKSSKESHIDARDHANDSVRVDASELRCLILGEGGNLGITQRGRVEYALNGGRCHTDAIDNSAGVDCSDHEVNIKILLSRVVTDGGITPPERDQLLADMCEEVEQHVLFHNYRQAQALNISEVEGVARVDEQRRMMAALESSGQLKRELEFLPDNETLKQRVKGGSGLALPELAVLLAYGKLALFKSLTEAKVVDNAYLSSYLPHYFPKPLQGKFLHPISQHSLSNEILSTQLTNLVVDRMGPTFIFRINEFTGADPTAITAALFLAFQAFEIKSIWSRLDQLDNKVPVSIQLESIEILTGLLERITLWVLRHQTSITVDSDYQSRLREAIHHLREVTPKVLASSNRLGFNRRIRKLTHAGLSRELATQLSALVPLSSTPDILLIAEESDRPLPLVAKVYFGLGMRLSVDWLRSRIRLLDTSSRWHLQAKSTLRHKLLEQIRLATRLALMNDAATSPRTLIDRWSHAHQAELDRYQKILAELKAGRADFASLNVAIDELSGLIDS